MTSPSRVQPLSTSLDKLAENDIRHAKERHDQQSKFLNKVATHNYQLPSPPSLRLPSLSHAPEPQPTTPSLPNGFGVAAEGRQRGGGSSNNRYKLSRNMKQMVGLSTGRSGMAKRNNLNASANTPVP